MSLKELAQSLDGMEYPFSLPDGIEVDKDFVIVFNMLGDMEFTGALNGSHGIQVCINGKEVSDNLCASSNCPYFKQEQKDNSKIDMIWHGNFWSFETNIPHETFRIMDNCGLNCEAIVFDIKNLESSVQKATSKQSGHNFTVKASFRDKGVDYYVLLGEESGRCDIWKADEVNLVENNIEDCPEGNM